MTVQAKSIPSRTKASDERADGDVNLNTIITRKLQARGIWHAAQMLGWRAQRDGWQYPVQALDGTQRTQRWKAYDSDHVPKYRWQPNKPEGCDYYFGDGLRAAIAQADGTLFVAAGEVDVLTYISADLPNVIAWFGETSIPRTLASDLEGLGVTHVIYLPDRDKTGFKSAVKLRDALRETTIHVDVRQLPATLGDKADTNDLWQAVDFCAQAFQQAIENAPQITLPAPKTPRRRDYTGFETDDTDLDYQRAVEAIFSQIEQALDIQRYRDNGWSQPVHCLFHDDKKPSANWNKDSGVMHCFACGESYSPKDVAEQLGMTYPTRKRRKSHTCTDETRPRRLSDIVEPYALTPFTPDMTVNLRYVSDVDLDDLPVAGGLLVRSPIGTGKTELIKRLMARHEARTGDEPRMLVITHRQSLAQNIADRLGIDSYKTDQKWLRSIPQLVIVYNSLWKLAAMGNSLPQYDMILIDEIEQFHQHLGGNTFRAGEAQRAYSVLRQLMHETPFVIGLDAHASDTSRKWLTSLMGTCFALDNQHVIKRGSMNVHSHMETVIEIAIETAKTGENPVLIPTNSRRTAKELETLFLGHFAPSEICMICSENSQTEEVQTFISEIDERLPDLKILIYSPSLGTGIDIQTPVSAVCGIFNSRPLAAPDLHQMIGRARNTQATHVYVQPSHGNLEIDWHRIYHRHESNALKTGMACEFDRYGVLSVTPIQRSMLKLLSMIEAEQNRSSNALLSHFVALAQGYTINLIDRENEDLREDMKESRRQVAEAEKEAVMSADVVDYEAYEAHRNAGTLTPDIRAGLERFKIEEMVGAEITSELYDDLHTSQQRETVRRFADLFDDVSALKDYDRRQAKQSTLMIKRKHYVQRQALLWRLIGDMWGEAGLSAMCQTEYSAEDIEARMSNYLTLHKYDIAKVFGWRLDQSHQPVAILRWLLQQIGLKLDSRQIMRDGERFRVYSVDSNSYKHIRRYAEQNLKQRQLKRTSAENSASDASSAEADTAITQNVVDNSNAGNEQEMFDPRYLAILE